MNVIKLNVPKSWFKHAIDYSKRKGFGFEVNGMRAWFKTFPNEIEATFEYKDEYTKRWVTFYRTTYETDITEYIIKVAQAKFLCRCGACGVCLPFV